MYLSGGFTKTVPTLLLLSLLFSGTQPWLRILTYFLHTQTHGSSSLSPAETKSPLQTSVLPARLAPLTHHIPGVHLKNPRDLHTDTITRETKNKQTSGLSRLQSAQVNPNMGAVMYLYFPASPTENKNFMKCWQYLLVRTLASSAVMLYT